MCAREHNSWQITQNCIKSNKISVSWCNFLQCLLYVLLKCLYFCERSHNLIFSATHFHKTIYQIFWVSQMNTFKLLAVEIFLRNTYSSQNYISYGLWHLLLSFSEWKYFYKPVCLRTWYNVMLMYCSTRVNHMLGVGGRCVMLGGLWDIY